jgi:hypothetical protein
MSVSKNLRFVESSSTYRKKTAYLGCFPQYIDYFIFSIIQYVRHVDLNLSPYVHHQIQREYQSLNQSL